MAHDNYTLDIIYLSGHTAFKAAFLPIALFNHHIYIKNDDLFLFTTEPRCRRRQNSGHQVQALDSGFFLHSQRIYAVRPPGGLPLISPAEGRYAEVAREMSQSHSWLVPTYDGLTYLDKPAFYFKTIALSFSLFGESEGVARLSSAFFGFLLLVVMFLFCQRVYDQRSCHAHRSHDATLHRVFATCHF